MLFLSVKLLLRFPTCTFAVQMLTLSPLPSCPSEENMWVRELEGIFLDSTKVNSTKSAVKCIVLLQEKWLVVCLFKQHRGLEHEAVVLKGACGEKCIQGYAVCVFNKSPKRVQERWRGH